MTPSPFEPLDSIQPEPTPVTPGALEVQERAQIDMQITTARKYPRPLAKVKADIIAFATLDEETAASCFYSVPRGDGVIEGPSVRLAEIAFSCWQNIRAATRIIETVPDGPNPHVVVQAMAFDLEKNTSVMLEKRRRITKKRSKPRPDEDDITLATNACSSIAFRDVILRVVPKAIINPACAAAKKVAIGEAKSIVARRTGVVARLKQMGVSEGRILAVVECGKVEDIGGEQLGVLIGLGTAIKEGAMTIEDAFPPLTTGPKKPAFRDGKPLDDDIPMARTEPARPEPVEGAEVDSPVVAAGSPSSPATAAAAGTAPEPHREVTMVESEAAPVKTLTTKPKLDLRDELGRFLDGNGISFSALQNWAVQTEWEPGWESYADLGDVPIKSIRRLLNAKGGLLKQLGDNRGTKAV